MALCVFKAKYFKTGEKGYILLGHVQYLFSCFLICAKGNALSKHRFSEKLSAYVCQQPASSQLHKSAVYYIPSTSF